MNEPTVLFKSTHHECLLFDDLVTGEGIQANQFLLIHKGEAALIDPGGDLTYNALSIAASRYCETNQIKFLFASHQDPDIISSLDRWLMRCDAKVVISRLWSRFLPHLASEFATKSLSGGVYDRIISVPDEGMKIPFSDTFVQCLPGHFMHSVGNLHFYDPISKILFTGDVGASIGAGPCSDPVEDFEDHIQYMVGFHRRYMACNKVCKLWANMVRRLDVEMIVPQHGRYFMGKEKVLNFLDWISELKCGTDLLTQDNYSVE